MTARRALYLAAYDVADPKRLRKVRQVTRQFATGGQKSVFECFLTASERGELLAEACPLIDENEDRLALLRVEERTRPLLLGIATPAVGPGLRYVG